MPWFRAGELHEHVHPVLMSVPQRRPKVGWFVAIPGEPIRPHSALPDGAWSRGADLRPLPGLQRGEEGVEGEGAGLLVGVGSPDAIPLGACVLSLGL